MCDYSLHLVASRPAKVGDKLVTTKFNNSLTRGFAAVGEPHVAVCLLPGTEVAFEREVECQHIFKIFRSQKLIGEKVARFRQIKTEELNAHHDALEWRSCCSPGSTKVSTRRCCSCRHSPRRRLRQTLKRALPTSAEGWRRTCLARRALTLRPSHGGDCRSPMGQRAGTRAAGE